MTSCGTCNATLPAKAAFCPRCGTTTHSASTDPPLESKPLSLLPCTPQRNWLGYGWLVFLIGLGIFVPFVYSDPQLKNTGQPPWLTGTGSAGLCAGIYIAVVQYRRCPKCRRYWGRKKVRTEVLDRYTDYKEITRFDAILDRRFQVKSYIPEGRRRKLIRLCSKITTDANSVATVGRGSTKRETGPMTRRCEATGNISQLEFLRDRYLPEPCGKYDVMRQLSPPIGRSKSFSQSCWRL